MIVIVGWPRPDAARPVPLHRQQAFADTAQPGLPVTEAVAERCLSLPIFPELTAAQQERVIHTLSAVVDEA